MEKLDRLRWKAGMAIEAFGVKLGIRVNTPEALDTLPDYLPPQWQVAASSEVDHLCSVIWGGASTRKGVRRYNILYNGSTRIARTMDTEEMLLELASRLDFQVALRSPTRLFVHAGVVAVDDQALVIPGRSRSGKSTLVKALVEAGATYYSDEYAVLDEGGWVSPYPRPLKLREGEAAKGRPIALDEMGGEVGSQLLRVGWILDTSHVPEKTFRPERMTMHQSILSLLDNTVSARVNPRRALRHLHQVAREARGLCGERGDAKVATGQLIQALSGGGYNHGGSYWPP